MDILKWVQLIALIVTFVTGTAIPLIIALKKAIKAKKEAKTEAEEEAAKNAILEVIKTGVVEAEELYKDFNAMLKKQGSSAGSIKKSSVMTKVQAFALENGITFDADFVSAQIDNIVEITRKVNGN